ncbi:imidazole glycerol phosphate synthase subunit HisH [Paradesertivirga mongoliensis]|uniref:Imidazole glycerol phosphate synthase subunit HisH n=1 Tax=Paradesertivirga mongoliensis TaxID=2100740 RepID=A0ABW4ZJ80_9SPHI|nr:imidazole glycerol phosphate synthase subunit HisH [Pedobacter mongoliensis]
MENAVVHIPNLSLGNTQSVANMIKRVGGEVIIAMTPEDLSSAKKIILPGVGAFDEGMNELRDQGWIDVLNKLVLEKKVPILGICLGMQFFFEGSEEGELPGLSWISGRLKRFVSTHEDPIKIPHMGWNALNVYRRESIIPEMEEELRYYFVHSYHAICGDVDDLVATAHHGSDITAAVQRNNIYGVQFHPEKSHTFGMALLKNFLSVKC